MSSEICPRCNEPQLVSNQAGVQDCLYCKARIINDNVICPACKRANEIHLETCYQCGEPLSVVGAVISRQKAGQGSQRLEQLKSQAGEIKAQAEIGSRQRMAVLNDEDRKRIESEQAAALKQKERDQRILKYAAIGAGGFLFLVAIISLLVVLL
jgi:hypothetical protein